MAFSKGYESTDAAPVKRFIGIAPVYVKGVNPTKAELDAFFGRESQSDPVYLSTVEVNGQKVPQIRIDILLESADKDHQFKTKLTFFLRRMGRVSSKGTRQVIDKYGRTAWATPEDIQTGSIPTYSSGPANLAKGYRPVYYGEENLVKFLIAYLGIPGLRKKVGEMWVDKTEKELEDCEAGLDHIDDYFKGNINELKEVLNNQPTNRVKVLLGVNTTDDGRQYQDVFNREFMKFKSRSTTELEKELKGAKEAGAYAKTEFEVCPVKEYTVTATEFKPTVEEQIDDLPFGPAEETSAPW